MSNGPPPGDHHRLPPDVPPATVEVSGHECFGKGCSEVFDKLEDMEYIDGKGNRDGRHFCSECASEIREGRR